MPLLRAVLALAMLAGGAWLAVQNLMRAQALLTMSNQVHATELALTKLLSAMTDAQTGQRGYLLTGDPSYLQPYALARDQIGADFAVLSAEPLQDPDWAAGVARLQDLFGRKLDVLGRTLQLYQSGHQAAAIALLRTNLGEQLMDQIRIEGVALQADIDRNVANLQPHAPQDGDWILAGELIVAACVLLGWTGLQQLRMARHFAANADRLERFTRSFGMGLGMIRTIDGQITAWSLGSERLYGYTAAEAVGRLSHELLCTLFPQPLSEIEKMLRLEGHWHGELLHSRRDGSELRVMSHWALHRRDGKSEDLVIEVNSDITSFAKTDRLLRTILEAAPALIYAKDLDGRILVANPPTLELIGKSWAEVEGHTDVELLEDREQGEVLMRSDRQLMLDGRNECLDEQVGTDATGAPRIWSSYKAPMLDGSGMVIGLVGVSIEITAKRRMEAQLRQRTADLERVHAELEDFAHIIAHDLRAPLQAFKSLAEWIGEDIGPAAGPKTLSYLALMGKRADRMSMLLEGLLTFSRVGHAKASSEAVDVGTLVLDISEMLAPPPELRVRFAGKNMTIMTPRAPLMHVLQNLISNAIKHHDRRYGEILIDAARTDYGVTISVADDGPGIPPAAHKKIFEIFQTLGTRASGETAGVGLSIVKKTVETHGGQVWVKSSPPERGTTFSFTWPDVVGMAVGKVVERVVTDGVG